MKEESQSADAVEPVDVPLPLGAIENGSVLVKRLAAYGVECGGGRLENCAEWYELQMCFEHLADWVSTAPAALNTLSEICDVFRIGSNARTHGVIMTCVGNTKRFADMLHAIEREFLMVPGEPDDDYPDDEPEPECLVNCWGSTVEQYVEQFRAALERIKQPAAQEKENGNV